MPKQLAEEMFSCYNVINNINNSMIIRNNITSKQPPAPPPIVTNGTHIFPEGPWYEVHRLDAWNKFQHTCFSDGVPW